MKTNMTRRTKPDIKKQLEAVLGHELSADAVERISLFQLVASSTFSDGFTTLRSLVVARPNQCFSDKLLDVSGVANTGSDGKSRFRLTNFICPAGEKFELPINVVATPLSSTPCFLTVNRFLVDNGADVEIQISTWNADGTAAPTVSFDWRCRVGLVQFI
jgi:hypothetical protein